MPVTDYSGPHAHNIAAKTDLIAKVRVAEREGRVAEARRLRRVIGGKWAKDGYDGEDVR